ncbi:MAG: hypothetical protein IKI51_03680 [Clostridia bacterium]|nr:hypothetical protein [Clostridia bacterium]
MLNAIKKNYHYIIFALFLGVELAIISMVTFYGDDYYYMTFFDDGFQGFLKLNAAHYAEVNGRAVVHLICELILADRSLWAYRVVTVASVGTMVYLVAFIASGCRRDDKRFPFMLCTSCVLFALINVGMANQTVYWITGAANYFYPLPVMLWYYTVYKKFAMTKFLPKYAPVAAFFASVMIEQCAFAALIITGLIIYTHVSNRKNLDIYLILTVICSVVGFCVLYFAPGNFVRQTYYPEFYSMSLYKRIISNIAPLTSLVLSKKGAAGALVAFMISSGAAALARKYKLRVSVAIINFAAALFVTVYAYVWGVTALGVIAAILTAAAFVTNILFAFAEFLIGERDALFFTLTPVILQAAMLISPIYGPRTVICSVVLMFVPTAKNIVEVFSAGVKNMKRYTRAAASAALVAAGILIFVSSVFPMMIGYVKNHIIQAYNMENVARCKEDQAESVTIFYLPDGDCKYTMPYDSTYHEYWYRIAFGLSPDVEMKYEYPNGQR